MFAVSSALFILCFVYNKQTFRILFFLFTSYNIQNDLKLANLTKTEFINSYETQKKKKLKNRYWHNCDESENFFITLPILTIYKNLM